MFDTSGTHSSMVDHEQYMLEYMLGRFSMLFTDMYSARPQLAQLECGRCDDGFGNIVQKGLSGHRATLGFLER